MMLWAWWVVVVAGIVLVAWLLISEAEVPRSDARPAWAPMPQPIDLDKTGVAVRVLFAETSDGLVALDCIPADDVRLGAEREVRACTPFTVTVGLPTSEAWATIVVDDVLHRWADDGAQVRLTVLKDTDGPQVRLMGGRTRVQLPLAA